MAYPPYGLKQNLNVKYFNAPGKSEFVLLKGIGIQLKLTVALSIYYKLLLSEKNSNNF